MGSYILNFTVYTMAMCGLISFALFVYKKFATSGFINKNSQFLNVEETLSLAPRKTLYVIRAGQERFLIASDAEKTTLISKLTEETQTTQQLLSQLYQHEKTEPQTNSAYTVDFESQLQQTKPTEQKIQRAQQPQQQYSYNRNTNTNYQKSNLEYNGKTTYIDVEDFPEIKTTKRAKKSNDIIKNMVNRMKG